MDKFLIIYSNNIYMVIDYVKRNSFYVENLDFVDKIKKFFFIVVFSGFKNMFMVVLLENYE